MSEPSLPPEEMVQQFAEKLVNRLQEGESKGEGESGGPTPPPPDVARFPKGFWKRVDYLLHHSEQVIESLKRDCELWELSRLFLVVSIVMAALYGAVMGATNLLQGSEMALGAKLVMILVTAIKVPALFLLTLAIILPPVYVSNAFVGARLPMRQMLALLLACVAITVTVLASMGTVAFFFALTSRSYHFIKLLHVVFFAYAGMIGLGYFVQCLKTIPSRAEHLTPSAFMPVQRTPARLFIAWLVLYMFVGTQMAWVLRPFVGSPMDKFQIFRPRFGNFYESVFVSIRRLTEKNKVAKYPPPGIEKRG